MNIHRSSFLAFIVILLVISPVSTVQAQTMPVVHAVLFYSPSCGHCHYVISEVLPPLFEEYGEQLQIVGIDVTQPQGQTLFLSTLHKFGQESNGVPFLVVGDTYLVGSVDIPEQLPGLVQLYLASGGVDWPDIPGLRESLAQSAEAAAPTPDEATGAVQTQPTAVPATPEPASTLEAAPTSTATPGLVLTGNQNSTWWNNFLRDPAGNMLSVVVLSGMLGALIWAGRLFRTRTSTMFKDYWTFGIPILCFVGFFVAGYLAYVETSQVTAICGPVGDCNTVQQSEYARLFGVLPIGVLGLGGYGLIATAWLVARYANHRLADLAAISIFGLTFAGTLFSIYLTFLEPFVIGATCAWCLTSAVLMTALMILSVEPAKLALLKRPLHGSLRRRYS